MVSTAVTPARPPVKAPEKHSFRKDVQGLRAVAVGLVVAAHAGATWVPGGFVGVDVFFVISGFLITGLLMADVAKGRVDFGKFYTRRALRILPAATLVIVTTGLASLYVLNTTRARDVMQDSVWASLFGANIKFARDGTDYFSDTEVSPLQHFWSLAVEEQFYLVWPAVLALIVFLVGLVVRRRSGRLAVVTGRVDSDVAVDAVGAGTGPEAAPPVESSVEATDVVLAVRPVPRGWIAAVLGVVGAASLWLSISQTASEPTAAYFSTFARAWELVAGALLAVSLPWLSRLPEVIRTVLTWAGVAGIAWAAVMFDDATPFPGSAALLPVLATCAVLGGGVGIPRWGANQLLGVQPFRFIGDISYSLYLWHWPLLILGAAWVEGPLNTRQSLKLVAAALVLSVLSYYLVENPVRKSKKIWGRRPLRPLLIWPVAVGSVVVLAVIGSSIDPKLPTGPAVSDSVAAGPAEVEQSVLAARAGIGIPVNLSPALENIQDDETHLFACSGYKKTSSDICQFGDPNGTKKIVVFGNSHATAWVPAVSEVAKAAGWQFIPLVKEACHYPGYVGADRGCTAWYKWVKKQLAIIKPDIVVMNAYTAGGTWKTALPKVISELKPLAGRLVMLSDPPGVNTKAVDCLQRRNATMATCTDPVRKATENAATIQQKFADKAKIEFISVKSWFCWDNSCPSVIGNKVVYADVGHLTMTYSRHLASVLGPALKLN